MKRVLAIFATLMALCSYVPAQSATITITGTVTDGTGTAPFSITVQTDAVNISSVTVTPQVAAPGTVRTLKVVATSTAGLPLTAPLPTGTGLTFTPVSGQPAGTFVWTFTF